MATLLVDPQRPRDQSVDRQVVDVAVGVLLQPDGRFLMATRPQGKAYAGYWEFPGGKLEPGESVELALTRELEEELGLRPTTQTPWHIEVVDYPHALVRLHFVKVTQWTGEPQMRESQQACWQDLPLSVSPVLPGAVPVLDRLARERGHRGPTHHQSG
jgi:8-oxo-dGTP diphosphatase